MTIIEKRNKALSINPLKTSSSIGAALAFLGFNRSMPMLHGSQGCSAFGKVFFVRHFREPIPLQTSAMDQVSTVMGADGNIVEGLKNICEKTSPELVGIATTGLSETQGSDVRQAIYEFREACPEYEQVKVVTVATPDYSGSMESGFAAAVTSLIDTLTPHSVDENTVTHENKKQITVLASSHLTPGDLEVIKDIIESFSLRAVVIPDLSDSLDGHLNLSDFSPLTIAGTKVSEFETLGQSIATVVIGASMYKAADLLKQRTSVADRRFDHLMGLDAMDDFISYLSEVSGNDVSVKLQRSREQLLDAMLDSHFVLGLSRVAIAAESDLLNALDDLLTSIGVEVVAAVAPCNAPVLQKVSAHKVKLGDLQDLEQLARQHNAEFIISNSHALETAKRLNIPLLRAGFPQYDLLGGYQKVWIGYQGARQALFDMANILISLERGKIQPYRSIYSQKPECKNATEKAIKNTAQQY